jgi:hypothetical protein
VFWVDVRKLSEWLSMAGALARHFERVEIFERDRLTASAASRSGTPKSTPAWSARRWHRALDEIFRTSSVSALDLAVALHEIVPEVPIVLATASADESGADALVAAGVSEVVRRSPYLCRDRRGFGALPDGSRICAGELRW